MLQFNTVTQLATLPTPLCESSCFPHLLKCGKFTPATRKYGGPLPAVSDNDAVAGQQSLIIAPSADHSATAAVSADDNGDDDDESNEPSPRAGTETGWGGRLNA